MPIWFIVPTDPRSRTNEISLRYIGTTTVATPTTPRSVEIHVIMHHTPILHHRPTQHKSIPLPTPMKKRPAISEYTLGPRDISNPPPISGMLFRNSVARRPMRSATVPASNRSSEIDDLVEDKKQITHQQTRLQ